MLSKVCRTRWWIRCASALNCWNFSWPTSVVKVGARVVGLWSHDFVADLLEQVLVLDELSALLTQFKHAAGDELFAEAGHLLTRETFRTTIFTLEVGEELRLA